MFRVADRRLQNLKLRLSALDFLEAARHAAARSINAVLTTTDLAIGRRIIEEEQRGRSRVAELLAENRSWKLLGRSKRATEEAAR